MVFPEVLHPGGRIAIVAPATTIMPEYVHGACERLTELGFEPVVSKHCLGPAAGSFSSSEATRLRDLQDAMSDPDIDAILCARGGYGCAHLLASAEKLNLCRPKWLIGFSDISALHALWQKRNVASIHGSMCKHLALTPKDDACTLQMLRILCSREPVELANAPHPYNRLRTGKGRLRGGNVAVLNDLAASDYDLLNVQDGEDVILFIEDIAEPIYAVERALMRLVINGSLQRAKGLVIGRFTDYKPDRNHASMEDMIHSLLERYGIEGMPIAFNFPIGHIDDNMPVIQGSMATLTVTPEGATLLQEKI